MDNITITLRHIVNFGIAAIIVDLVYFVAAVAPALGWSGLLFVPTSWDFSYSADPEAIRTLFREVGLIVCFVAAVCIFGWAKSLIEKNV